MSNEIKEILDDLKLTSEQTNARLEFTQKGCETLLDYITNLQEENNHNEKMLKIYKRVVNLFKKDLITMSNLYTEEKSRCEKAIEYIKEDMYGEPNELYGLVDGEHLLNILNGGGKE